MLVLWKTPVRIREANNPFFFEVSEYVCLDSRVIEKY